MPVRDSATHFWLPFTQFVFVPMALQRVPPDGDPSDGDPFLQPFSFVIVALGAALLLGACGSGEGEGERDAPVPAVEVVQARYGALPLREQLSGTVEARGQVQVYPERAGRLVSVSAENGDFVREGEALARISGQSSRAQLSQAQASLESAQARAQEAKATLEEIRAQFKRTQKLAEQDMVSEQKLESQRAQMQSAEASYQQAKAQVQQARGTVDERAEAVGQTVVRAPISGRVGQRNAEVGMQADGQTPLFTIGDLSKVQVEVPVTQEMLGRIAEGQPARITASGLRDSTIGAEVSRISPFIESGTYSAEAEIDVNNENGPLRPGMFVNVDVSYGETRKATLVPVSALHEHPETGRRGVYVAPSLGSELQPRPVESSAEGSGSASGSAAGGGASSDGGASGGSSGGGGASLVGPVPVQFRPVEVVAEGGQIAGVRGIEPDTWVVVVGQHLLESGGGGRGRRGGSEGGQQQGPPEARARPILWSRVVDLQQLQQQDLLRQFMDKQQRRARSAAGGAVDTSGGASWRADTTGASS
jgi:RND family efflux transporter MFP subunit